MKREKKKKRMKYYQVRWLFAIDFVVVIGGIFAFGTVCYYTGIFDRTKPSVMFMMILPMIILAQVVTVLILHFLEKKIQPLLDGIHRVADGDLDFRMDEKKGKEFKSLYVDFNKMLDELNKSQNQLINATNDLTHEFKTPLTSIQGFAELLTTTGTECETPERLEYLQVIESESARLATLATNVLLLSKVESCEILTNKTTFNISELIKRDVILLLPQLDKKNISIDLDLPDISFYSNSEMLEHVFINLINNSIKFTNDGGTIKIKAYENRDDVTVELSDDGIGMNEETQKHIFEKYYRGSGPIKAGNGIGLSIVKRVVDLCDGTITVQSKEDVGTRFTIVLPKKYN